MKSETKIFDGIVVAGVVAVGVPLIFAGYMAAGPYLSYGIARETIRIMRGNRG